MKTRLLKTLREEKNITLEQLSGDVGISVSQLSRFESGDRQPRVVELERIADRLGVGAWTFLDKPPVLEPPGPTEAVPIEEVRLALELLARKTGMRDNAAQEVADLILEEMQDRGSPVLDQRTAELRVAFDRIVRRYGPRSSD